MCQVRVDLDFYIFIIHVDFFNVSRFKHEFKIQQNYHVEVSTKIDLPF
jgi:hypothetical protein